MKLNLTLLEKDALKTPIFVARENALFELNKAKQNQAQPGVVEYLQARFDALDKLMEAVDDHA